MPFQKLAVRPGVSVELTQTLNEGGWSDSQLVRFFAGQIQKLGGWARLAGTAALNGVCRGLFGWADLLGTPYLAAGTNQNLYVVNGGSLSDITPVVHTSNTAPALSTDATTRVTITDLGYSPNIGDRIVLETHVSQGGNVYFGQYNVVGAAGAGQYIIDSGIPGTPSGSGGLVAAYTTTSGSPIVTVALPGHGLSVGSVFTIGLSVSVGGLTLTPGVVSVSRVIDATTFQFLWSSAAASGATVHENSSNMRIAYLLPIGEAETTPTGGWGIGDWGLGDWGLPNVSGTTPVFSSARTWSLDHFGQDLIASPDLGGIYLWAPPDVVPATVIDASAPTQNRVVFCMAGVQIIVAAGCEASGTFAPTLVRWCDSGDFTDWVATVTNQAGSFQLSTGSRIVSGLSLGISALIWTDVDLYLMTYISPPFIFAFNKIGDACEAISKKAPVAIGNTAIWPSTRGFYEYEGAVRPLACPVWDWMFNNIDPVQSEAVFGARNTEFNEVSWFFPCLDGQTRYVKYNYLERVWDKGTLDRTAWTDRSPFGQPMGADSAGLIQAHETGNDADGAAMDSFGTTGYLDIGDGEDFSYVNVVIPDFVSLPTSTILLMTVLVTDEPFSDPTEYGPFVLSKDRPFVNVSFRGRQVAFKFQSKQLGAFFRLGSIRIRIKSAGRR